MSNQKQYRFSMIVTMGVPRYSSDGYRYSAGSSHIAHNFYDLISAKRAKAYYRNHVDCECFSIIGLDEEAWEEIDIDQAAKDIGDE